MVDAGIGRLLIASLHQGIADVVPTRLEFYENWLSPAGLSDGRMGLAPLGAVLSFVTREEPPANRLIPAHAGACAAEWAHAATSALRKRLARQLSPSLRARFALGGARRLVGDTISASKVKTRLRAGTGFVEIRSPLFDYLREPSSTAMRQFYAAAYTEMLRLYGVPAAVLVDVDAAAVCCRLTITVEAVPLPARAMLDGT